MTVLPEVLEGASSFFIMIGLMDDLGGWMLLSVTANLESIKRLFK
jgi:hypothetical protein